MAHHRHIFGASGTGKSTLMKQWLLSDIYEGRAVLYIDPHGQDTSDTLSYIPPVRRSDTLLFDLCRHEITWNPLVASNIQLAAQGLTAGMKSAWGFGQANTARMEGVLYNALVALMEAREGLFGLYLILTSPSYRTWLCERISDPVVVRYWRWFDTLTDKQQFELTESTLNKVQILMADPRIRAISGKHDRLNLPGLLRDKVLLVSLPQGELGLQKTKLLGSIMLAQVHQLALARDPTVPLGIYVDEAHTFAPDALAEMLSGIRKANVMVTVAHQYLGQLDPILRASLKANADAYIFRTSYEDSHAFPAIGATLIQPYELPDFHYWHYRTTGRPELVVSEDLLYKPYEASERKIIANMRRNFMLSSESEIVLLLEKFS